MRSLARSTKLILAAAALGASACDPPPPPAAREVKPVAAREVKPVAARVSGEQEIEALLLELEASGVQMERNGEVYSNADAVKWLRSKLQRRKDQVKTAEDFITRVADHSSETKEPYLFIDAAGNRIASAAWLEDNLRELRKL